MVRPVGWPASPEETDVHRIPIRRTIAALSLSFAGFAGGDLWAAPLATLEPTPLVASSRLDLALDTIQAEKIRSDVFFIASDELGGRDTPSLGLRIAARYIRARLERLGWTPGAKDGFFQRYPDHRDRLDEEATKLSWEREGTRGSLRFGEDYFFPSTIDCRPLEVSGPVVFCGDGGQANFGKLGVQGKWALCTDDGTEVRKLRGPARQAGALGVIVAPGATYAGEPYERRFAKELARQRRGFGTGGSTLRRGDEDGDAPFPQVWMSGRSVADLLAAAGTGTGAPAAGTDLGIVLFETRRLTGPVDVENVCGFWPGSDPVLGKETIIISAHYDHVGTRDGVVYNGADDNGSGSCGLMAIAEALTTYGPMRRSVMLIWVSGEETGLWGSEAWTKDPWLPGDARPICDINIDMIGRNAPDKLLITPTKARPEYNGLVRIAEQVAPLEGFPTLGSCDEYWSRSDHKNFADNLKIPVTFLFSDIHEDYHQPTDDPEKVDNDKIRRVSRMVVRMIEGLQGDELSL
jgi:hypothetical protein